MVENQQINETNLKRELYELYIDIKSYLISLNENITNDSEIETSSDPLLIIKTIHDYINIIKNNKKINLISQLENIIIKLEKDLKYHIKNEFMLKIQKDSADSKIRRKVRYEGGKFLNNDRKDNEIKILRRENSNIKREVKKMEIKIRNLEKKGLEDQGIIDELKIKIIKSDKKLEEMEKELEVLKNKKSMEIENHENKNIYLKIVDKNSLSKININSIGNNKMGMRLKRDLTNYQWPLSQVNYESVKSNNNNQRTVDNTSNKLIIHTFDKVNNRNNKNVIAPLRNVKLKDEFKYKNNSISMRSDENKKFEIIGKYLPNNVNKYIPNTKVRNLSKDNNIKYGLFNLPSSSSNVNIRHPKKEEKNFHEYSGFNKLI